MIASMTTMLLAAALSAEPPQCTSPTSPTTLRQLVGEDDGQGADGAWAEYAQLVDGKPDLTTTFRVLQLNEGKPGAPARWLEIWVDKQGKGAWRLPLDGQAGDALYLKRGKTIYAIPGGERGPSACKPGKMATFKELTVETLIGRLPCRYSRTEVATMAKEKGKATPALEFWSSNDVPPLSMVRMIVPNGSGFEVVAKGSGATSSFPERFTATPLPTTGMLKNLLPLDLQKKLEEQERARAEPPCDPAKATCPGADAGAAAAGALDAGR
ncbi:MAG TPA: hypothetical protein VGK67_22535 [Myxococcales bacterium]|jgi:hypothetical protein